MDANTINFLLTGLFVLILFAVIFGLLFFLDRKGIISLSNYDNEEAVAEPEPLTKNESGNMPSRFIPYRRRQLLTKTEYIFYGILRKKCDDANLLICPKVRMEDFIAVTTKKQRNKFRNHIKSRHVDFLLCDSKLRILAAIELDDKSHSTKKAKAIDKFKNEVYQNINLPLHRIKVGDDYNEKIDEVINTYKTTH